MEREAYMKEALALAGECLATGDVPVGCVVVAPDGTVIGRGRNRREERKDARAHAELEAIGQACEHLGSWRLTGCALYVTLEPCPMCAGAILNARVAEVWYGAREEKTGCCGSVVNLFAEGFPYRAAVRGGLLAEESAELLRKFFESRREKNFEI